MTGQLPEAEHNAPLHLFSALKERVAYGARHYRKHSDETSTLLDHLLKGYQREGVDMPYTMEDFKRDSIKEKLKEMTPEERLEALQSLPPEERLEGLSPEERLRGLSVGEIEEFLRRQRETTAPAPKPKQDSSKSRRRPKR